MPVCKFTYLIVQDVHFFTDANIVAGQLTMIQSTHSYTIYFKICFNIILPSTPRSYKWSLLFLITILYAFLISPMRAKCLVHPIILDLIVLIIFGEEC
jgi:hypothetical protein